MYSIDICRPFTFILQRLQYGKHMGSIKCFKGRQTLGDKLLQQFASCALPLFVAVSVCTNSNHIKYSSFAPISKCFPFCTSNSYLHIVITLMVIGLRITLLVLVYIVISLYHWSIVNIIMISIPVLVPYIYLEDGLVATY